MANEKDPESGRHPTNISHWKMITDQGVLTEDVVNHHYEGAGTADDPYVVVWLEHDARNPFHWSKPRKWAYAMSMAVATLSVSFCSSAFSGGK